MPSFELPYLDLFWLIAGIIIAVRLIALLFRILNRIVDRLLPPLASGGDKRVERDPAL